MLIKQVLGSSILYKILTNVFKNIVHNLLQLPETYLPPPPRPVCVFACANQRLTLRFSIFILKQGLSLKQVITDRLEWRTANSRNLPTPPPPFRPLLFPYTGMHGSAAFLFECWHSNSGPQACKASSSLTGSSPLVEIIYSKA